MTLRVTREEQGGRVGERRVADLVIISVTGDLTMGAGGRMVLTERVRHLLQRGHRHLVLDLRGVRYADSFGLGELAESNAAAHTRGASFKLSGVGQRLADLLVLTKLASAFEIEGADTEATRGDPLTADAGRR